MSWTRSAAAAGALAGAALWTRAQARRAERAHPPAGRFLEIGGARVHYVEAGDGPPLVLLHGLGSMVDDFLVSGLVEAAAAKYRVIAIDRPGYGYSTRPRGRRWDPPAQAALVREALRVLGVHRPIVLGHSWGTTVAIALALADPGVPRSLVLASGLYFPSVRFDAPFLVPPALPIAGALLRHTLSPLAGRAMWPLWLRLLFSPAPVPPRFRALAGKALRPEPLRAVAQEALQLLPATLAGMKRYRELTLPVVLVTGRRDRYVDPRAHTARLRPMLVNAELLVSPEAGHMVHHADPALVLNAIDRAAWG